MLAAVSLIGLPYPFNILLHCHFLAVPHSLDSDKDMKDVTHWCPCHPCSQTSSIHYSRIAFLPVVQPKQKAKRRPIWMDQFNLLLLDISLV